MSFSKWDSDSSSETGYTDCEDGDISNEPSDSSDWETDEESEIKQPSPPPLKNLKPIIKSAPSYRNEKDLLKDWKEKANVFHPQNFGYVSLKVKVLGDYLKRHFGPLKDQNFNKKRKFVKWTDYPEGKEIPEWSAQKIKLGVGADLENVVNPNLLLVEDKTPPCLIGLKEVGKILNDQKLTISQKYKSLGIEEDPYQEEAPEEQGILSCWQWLCYKFKKIYCSQWPISFEV